MVAEISIMGVCVGTWCGFLGNVEMQYCGMQSIGWGSIYDTYSGRKRWGAIGKVAGKGTSIK